MSTTEAVLSAPISASASSAAGAGAGAVPAPSPPFVVALAFAASLVGVDELGLIPAVLDVTSFEAVAVPDATGVVVFLFLRRGGFRAKEQHATSAVFCESVPDKQPRR